MLGSIILNYIEFIEDRFGFRNSNQMIVNANIPSNAHISGVELYSVEEFNKLVQSFLKIIRMDEAKLYFQFGEYLAIRLNVRYRPYTMNIQNYFDLYQIVGSVIRFESRSLFPECEYPEIKLLSGSDEEVKIEIHSPTVDENVYKGIISKMGELYDVRVKIDSEVDFVTKSITFEIKASDEEEIVEEEEKIDIDIDFDLNG